MKTPTLVKHPAASRGASLRNPAKPEAPFLPVASQRASWRRRVKILVLSAILTGSAVSMAPCENAKWPGVDESVIEKFAEKAGRPAREPLINTDQGDLLLFVFLIAGAVGGFIAGYYFRGLFVKPGTNEAAGSHV